MARDTTSSIIFPKSNQDAFYKELRVHVDEYFKKKNIHKQGNFEIYFKGLVIIFSFFLIYSMLFLCSSSLPAIFCYAFLGFNAALIMFNVGHDICHECYSKNQIANSCLLICGEILFANKHSWKLKHNEGHHTFTNIEGHDDDIDLYNMIRISLSEKRLPVHAFQHLYAPLLYCFLSLQWLFFSDMFYQIKVFRKKALGWKPVVKTILCKILHICLLLVLPIIYAPVPFWAILSGFLCLHFVFGLTMSIVFQLAHVVENVEFPKPNERGEMEHSWAIHEMETTSDFGSSNVLHYLLGGLTFQVEHHLFPNISHVYYKDISLIVQKTAKKFAIPYRCNPTLWGAIKSHFRFLKKMGQPSEIYGFVAQLTTETTERV